MKRAGLYLMFALIALSVENLPESPAARVETAVPPKIVSFTATPRIIKRGQTVIVAWETRGTQSMALEWRPALHPDAEMKRRTGLPPSGSITDQPEETTIYILECEDTFGHVCTSAGTTVLVK